MKINFLYFADCPSHEKALERLRKVMREERIDGSVTVHEVKTEAQARALDYIGSPTIRVEGRDIDPEGLSGEVPGLACRIYRLPDGRISPLPDEDTIRRALRQASECRVRDRAE